MENCAVDSKPRNMPNKTKAQPSVESTGEALGAPGVPAVKVTDNDQPPTSSPESRDRIESGGRVSNDDSNRVTSSASSSPPSSSSSSTRDESKRSTTNRPSKAERILGLTSRDFASAASEARRRGDAPSSSSDRPSAPPPSNLDLKTIPPLISIGSSPRTNRRHGGGGSPISPPSPSDSSRKRCPQKSPAKSSGGLRPPTDCGGGFAPFASASNTDLKVMGNGSEVDSDADVSSVGDDGGSSGVGSSPFVPKKSSEHRGRDRFKKILRPVTRSKSAGAGDRGPPAHALFLRHQFDQKPPQVNRSTDDVMRNSADYTESDEETTDGASASGKIPAGSKQKKDRFSFFRRSDCHSGQSSSPPNAVLPSSDTLQGWTKSFEKLLADKYGIKLFREFLRREFSDENIEFWIECEKYRHLSSEKQRITESKRIFREFVAVQSPSEVNLDSKTRETTEVNLSRADPKLFEASQKRIEALMEKDSYPRFLQSDLFQRLLQQRQAADNSLRVT